MQRIVRTALAERLHERRRIARVRRVGERDVEGVRASGRDVRERVAAHDRRRRRAERVDVGAAARAAGGARSTKVTCAAPRESASRPSAPEPANRSSTRAPGRSCCSALIHASRTRSVVGRVRSPGGAAIVRPRQRPAMILMRRPQVDQPRLQPVRPFQRSSCSWNATSIGACAPGPGYAAAPPCGTRSPAGVRLLRQHQLQVLAGADLRGRAVHADAAHDEHRLRVAEAERPAVAQQRCSKLRDVASRSVDLQVDCSPPAPGHPA
jgi:hypothetical protein